MLPYFYGSDSTHGLGYLDITPGAVSPSDNWRLPIYILRRFTSRYGTKLYLTFLLLTRAHGPPMCRLLQTLVT